MEVRIQAIHFDATEKLQDFIQKKTAKLEKYCDDINKVEVSLKVVKPETAMNKEASIKVLVPNGEFFAEKVSDTFEEVIGLPMNSARVSCWFSVKMSITSEVIWLFSFHNTGSM